MKYYMADADKLNEDGSISIIFTSNKVAVSQEDFEKHIDDFYSKGNATAEKIADSRAILWQYLNSGKEVTVGRKTLSIKKTKDGKRRTH